MFHRVIVLIFSISVLLGCNETSRPKTKDAEERFGRDVIHYERLYNDTENALSFPVWFDAKIICDEGIERIDRSIYSVDAEDTLDNGDAIQSLRERRQYWFFPSGRMKKVRVSHFYDDTDVGHMTFGYYDTIDRYGFSAAYKMDATGFLPDADLPADFPFRLDRFIERNDKRIVYKDEVSKSQLFAFTNSRFWGVVSIDSIANPRSEDWIVFGNMKLPIRQFHLRNKVLIEEDTRYSRNKNGSPKRILSDNYPFYVRRSFVYGKKRQCVAFIDSTFSDEGFLSRTINKIKRDAQGRVTKIVRSKENQRNNTNIIRVEYFHYETSKRRL